MREWSISPDGPLSLRIAADARYTIPDYADDQIWELVLQGGDPPAVALRTTYGLRAQDMRIFPGFGWGKASVINPESYVSPPSVRCFLPNYLRVTFSPFVDLFVLAEYWATDSKIVAGRFTLSNQGLKRERARLHLYTVLSPGENPQVMDDTTFDGVTVLTGRSGSLKPMVFLTGGASVSPSTLPSLSVSQFLDPGETKSWIWVHAGMRDQAEAFRAAQALTSGSWDAEIAKLELTSANQVEILTGEPDWDVALALAQKVALGSFIGPTRHLPYASFVSSRLPEHGYSKSGDGTDYDSHWEGQIASQAYFNLAQILPSAPELAKGIVRNFIATQTSDGVVDWKPGLGGQRKGALSVPLLATLTWKVYQHTEDREFLEDTFPRLLDFFNTWFTKAHDNDQDGHPEWDHLTHAVFENSPTFVPWHSWGQGLDISKAETPDLAAYLYRECNSLIKIAELVDHEKEVPQLQVHLERLRDAIENSWSDETNSYHHVDRDTHFSTSGQSLGSGEGSFSLDVDRAFDPPVRVLIRSRGAEGLSHALKVFIHGRGRRGRGRVERLTERRFQWFWEFGTATSEKTYTEIERIEVSGLGEEFVTDLHVADYSRQDLTLLLPLWAGVPSIERAERLVKKTLLDPNRFWKPFGLPNCSAQDPAYSGDNRDGSGGVWMLWNAMLGEGLVDYGYLDEAAELVRRLMAATLNCLKTDKAFRKVYHPDLGEGLGDRDDICGVFPFGLFLYTLGLRLITPQKVWLRPCHPFPWPVIVRWLGLQIECLGDRAIVMFPDGERVEVKGKESQIVEQIPAESTGV